MIKYLCLLLFSAFIIGCANKNIDIQKEIDKTKSKFAPDSRTQLFDVTSNLENGKIILNGETDTQKSIDYLLKNLKGFNMPIENNINILPDKKLDDKEWGIVNLSLINLRKEPKNQSELVSQAHLGMIIKVLKENNGWYLIKTPDNYLSWTEGYGFIHVDNNEANKWKNEKKLIITKENCYAYSNPNIKSERVTDLTMTNLLKILSKVNDFWHCEMPDGKDLYIEVKNGEVFSDWLQARNANAKNILSYAHKFMGLPYLWGGTSPRGLDCSGFTKTVFFMNGFILPRDASQQVNIGELVEIGENFENLLPGDLLFFGKKASEGHKERITHVGIYKGNLEFIHESGKVKIESFDRNADNFSEYRYNGFIRARRILNSKVNDGIKLISESDFYF